MIEKAEIQVLTKIKKAKRGSLFFIENFLTKTNSDAIRKALERLVKKGEIIRIAQGIYVRPASDPLLGQLTPSIETIAKAIAKRDKARIVPTGVYALNRLGLSTQVPMNVVFLTDGSPRCIPIGKCSIKFKKVTPKNLMAKGEISGMVIQALRVIGKDKVTSEELSKIRYLLKKESPANIIHDAGIAPAWIAKILTWQI